MPRPRSDAISFSSRRGHANNSLCRTPPNEHFISTHRQSPGSEQNSLPDLPSPTQPLFPTKVSKLVRTNQNYTSTIRTKFDNNFPSPKVPLVQVQQPTIDTEDSDTEIAAEHASPGCSLETQATIHSESDSVHLPDQSYTSFSSTVLTPSESLPRDTSDVSTHFSGMINANSRDSKSCLVGNCSEQDLEDSDDAFIDLVGYNDSHKDFTLSTDVLDVEKSLSPVTLRKLRQSPSILQQKLQVHMLFKCSYTCT